MVLQRITEHRREVRNHQRKHPSERGVGVLDCGNIAANYSVLMSAFSFFHLIAKTAGIVCQALDSVNMWHQYNNTVERVRLHGSAYTIWLRHHYNTIFRYSGDFSS